MPLRTVFIMEQALGHVTHYGNLQAFADRQRDIAPVWRPIPFEVQGLSRLVPGLRSNWSARASWRARRALEAVSEQVDAIVFHTQVTSLFSTRFMRQIPSIISLDATPLNYDSVGEHYGHKPAADNFLDRQKYRLTHRAFHAADGLVTWSDWARRSLIEDYGVSARAIRVLAPGAGRAYFDIGRHRVAAAAVSERTPVRLLFVGGDFHRKGGPELLQSLAETALARVCRLDIVTQSDVTVSGPNVTVHRGLQANSPALLELFTQADVFVLPSHAECLALVLMEATAAALPVITTDVGALGEAVIPGTSGLVIQPGDVRALYGALTALVADSELRRSMGRAGYAQACRKFDAERNNRALLDFVIDAAERRAQTRRAA